MPTASLRPCLQPGCPELVKSGRCSRHASAQAKRSNEARPNFRERGYSGEWDKFSRGFRRAYPLCGQRIDGMSPEHSVCVQQGLVRPGSAVDHIKPLTGPDDPSRLDPGNCQTLCASCHARKTATEDGGFGNKRGRVRPVIGLDGWPIEPKG